MGHSSREVWGYTPRQVAGFLQIAGKRRKREYAEALAISASGSRGDPKEINRILKDAEKD